jgi:hypothetical protein
VAIAQPLWSRWQAPHPLGLLPPEVAIEEIGLVPQRSVWRNTAAVLGVDTSALSAFSTLGLGSDAGASAGSADGPGSRFSRLAYRVTVGGVEYTASGLLSEATLGGDGLDGNAGGRLGGRRGLFVWLHGSESLRAAALSRTVTAGADGLVTNPDGQCCVPPTRAL